MRKIYLIIFILLNTILLKAQWFQLNNWTMDYFYSTFFVDQNTGWIVGQNGGIYKTQDGGITWEVQLSGVTTNLYSVFFISPNIGWVVGSASIILKTTDGGSNWIPQYTSVNTWFNEAFFINNTEGWLVGGNGTFLFTVDGGETWQQKQTNTSNFLNSVYFINSNYGFVVGGGGTIFHTTDGGDSWIDLSLSTYTKLNCIRFASESIGWIVGEALFKTNDSGKSWLPILKSHKGSMSEIDCIDSLNAWIATDGHYLRTTNGGTDWITQENPSLRSQYSICFADENNGWSVGNNGTILKTTNGGVTFIENDFTKSKDYLLQQNYPNPFNPSTIISYQLPITGNVTLKVFDVIGKEIVTLIDEEKNAGSYEVEYNASHLANGVYFYQLKAGDFVQTKKMILMK